MVPLRTRSIKPRAGPLAALPSLPVVLHRAAKEWEVLAVGKGFKPNMTVPTAKKAKAPKAKASKMKPAQGSEFGFGFAKKGK